MDELSYVGKSVPRKDGPAKVSGRAEYTVDVSLPGMLCGKVLRSPHPHARIVSIDTSKAEQLRGVKAVVTAKDSLKIKHGFVQTGRYPAKGVPDRKISYKDSIAWSIQKKRGDSIIGVGHFRTMKDEQNHPSLATTRGRWTENYSSYAQVAEVEVDTETGIMKILKVTTAHDCGFPLNPMLVEGQIDGQVSMAQGHVSYEEVLEDKGAVVNPSFLEYRIPCALDMVETDYLDVITEQYKKDKHYDTKEVGEGYVAGTIAAVANALYNATGVRLKQTPFYPHRIFEGLGQMEKNKGR